MKKKVGISFTHTNFRHYWNWFVLQDLRDDLDLIELSFEKNNVADIAACDGFILSGGVDVDPSFYSGKKVYGNSPAAHKQERDIFEEKIYRCSQANKLPVLGICRGMQLINVLHGGKLIQDLGPGNARHKEEVTDKEHTIITKKDSLLYEITGAVTGHVNSAHHQGIDFPAIGENLLPNVYDEEDNTLIEGMEFRDKTNKGFMLCVQWHPERMRNKEANPFSQKIKERFLEEIRKIEK